MPRRTWLYFFVVILAAGAVVGIWSGQRGITPHPTSPTRGEENAGLDSRLRGNDNELDQPAVLPDKVLLDVPFTSQAPLREWKDPRQQDGCEEAVILMAAHWVRGEPFASAQAAKEEILALSKFQEENYGYYQDTDAADTAKLFKDYFGYDAEVSYGVKLEDIKRELAAGNLVIVPVNGRALGNPYFTPPGPERHMLVIIGYDETTSEFITNDAGIMRGRSYRYPQKTVMNALRDYPSGKHEPFIDMRTAMIIIKMP